MRTMTDVLDPEAAPAAVRQLATFVVDGLLCGVDVLTVQEVIRHQTMTPVPCAPRVVEGLINLRGQIVTAIDMRRRLGLPERPDALLSMNVVVRTAEGVVSLLVDEIGDVVEVKPDWFEVTPDTIGATVRSVIDGVYKLSGRLLLTVDVERIASVEGLGD